MQFLLYFSVFLFSVMFTGLFACDDRAQDSGSMCPIDCCPVEDCSGFGGEASLTVRWHFKGFAL